MPSVRPRWSPCTTSPSNRKGSPRKSAASRTSPAATRPRMWLEEIVSPAASTSGVTLVSNSEWERKNSGVPRAPLPKRKFSPTATRPAPRRSISTSCTNSSALCLEKPRSKGITTSSSTPRPAIRSRLTGKGLISLGVASGWITDSGCGSKVSTVSEPSITARCPRWTPSKVPMATRRGAERGSTSWRDTTFMPERTLRRAGDRHRVARRSPTGGPRG